MSTPSVGNQRTESAVQRISVVVGGWTYREPLLLAAWNLHSLHENDSVETIRTGRRRIEFNPQYVGSLSDVALAEILKFEMIRVVLGHPYDRRRDNAEISYAASNIVVQECIHSLLPIPSAAELFDDPAMAGQYFERYYQELRGRQNDDEASQSPESKSDGDQSDDQAPNENSIGRQSPDHQKPSPDEPDSEQQQSQETDADSLQSHTQQMMGQTNVELWQEDDLTKEQMNLAIERIDSENTWGSIGASGRDMMRARLNPHLDYAAVLRRFHRSIVSSRRTLTRMKANRRYGLDQLGSRYTTEIRLLMAIDVSGSMTNSQIEKGLSVVNRFFRHGVCQTDLLQFDQQVHGGVLPLRRRRYAFEIGGGGGTNFQCVLDYLTRHDQYDGAIIYTDGCATAPQWPNELSPSRRPPLVWLLSDREKYDAAKQELQPIGPMTYVQ